MLNDEPQAASRAPSAAPEGSGPGPAPDEIEAVEEFETAPQVASGESSIPPAEVLGGAGSGAPPPSAVESFERAAPRSAPATSSAPSADPTAEARTAGANTGPSTRCPRCGTENAPGVAFCRQCNQRLVSAAAATVARPAAPAGMQTCPRCGTVNRSGIAFCQNCGANLRASAPASGSVAEPLPVSVARSAPRAQPARSRPRAVLGPLVLFIGAVGLGVAWVLPFAYGRTSLLQRSFGGDGYGIAFWNGYPDVEARLVDQAYFGLAAAVPILVLLLAVLSLAGALRARPGMLQLMGLLVALVWALGLAAVFGVVEVVGADASELTALLRSLSPAGIIFFLSSIIVVIGVLTRFARS